MPKMNEAELQQYGKKPGSEWWIDKENRIEEGKEIECIIISPYKIPWNKETDGKRPNDYFDKREIRLFFKTDQDIPTEVHMAGVGHFERIKVFQGGKEVEMPEQNYFLRMDSTFPVSKMHDMIEYIRSSPKLGDTIYGEPFISPYLYIYSYNKYARDEVKQMVNKNYLDAQAILTPYIERMLTTEETERVVVPIISNDKHWYLCVIDKENGQKMEITIIDSTKKSNQIALECLQEDYYDQFINTVINPCIQTIQDKNSSTKLKEIPLINPEDIHYMEVLQYGIMGCGITAIRNMRDIIHQDFSMNPFEQGDLRRLGEYEGYCVLDSESNEYIHLTPTEAEQLFDGEAISLINSKGNTVEIDPKKSIEVARINHVDFVVEKNKAIASDPIKEAYQRATLALALNDKMGRSLGNEKESKKMEILDQMKADPFFKQQRAISDTTSQIGPMKKNLHNLKKDTLEEENPTSSNALKK